jgi:hypothetical protein
MREARSPSFGEASAHHLQADRNRTLSTDTTKPRPKICRLTTAQVDLIDATAANFNIALDDYRRTIREIENEWRDKLNENKKAKGTYGKPGDAQDEAETQRLFALGRTIPGVPDIKMIRRYD